MVTNTLKPVIMKSLLFLLLVTLTAAKLFAQSNELIGRISNKQGEKMSSVSIVIKETREGTTSNNNGRFKLTTKKSLPLTLEFTSVGFQPYSVRITNTS